MKIVFVLGHENTYSGVVKQVLRNHGFVTPIETLYWLKKIITALDNNEDIEDLIPNFIISLQHQKNLVLHDYRLYFHVEKIMHYLPNHSIELLACFRLPHWQNKAYSQYNNCSVLTAGIRYSEMWKKINGIKHNVHTIFTDRLVEAPTAHYEARTLLNHIGIAPKRISLTNIKFRRKCEVTDKQPCKVQGERSNYTSNNTAC